MIGVDERSIISSELLMAEVVYRLKHRIRCRRIGFKHDTDLEIYTVEVEFTKQEIGDFLTPAQGA